MTKINLTAASKSKINFTVTAYDGNTKSYISYETNMQKLKQNAAEIGRLLFQ